MKVIKYIIFFGVTIISLAYYLIPAETISKIAAPNWADIVSAAIALLGLMLAFTTYANWHSGKIKEDAYNSVKRYASLLAEVEDTINEVHYDISGITPLDPNLVVQKKKGARDNRKIRRRYWHYRLDN